MKGLHVRQIRNPPNYSNSAFMNFQIFDGNDAIPGAVFSTRVAAEYKKKEMQKKRRRDMARAKNEAMRSLGMKKVRGALGGTYWE